MGGSAIEKNKYAALKEARKNFFKTVLLNNYIIIQYKYHACGTAFFVYGVYSPILAFMYSSSRSTVLSIPRRELLMLRS